MENLPPPLIADILSRLPRSGDLGAARLVCRALRSASHDVSAVRLVCSHDHYLRCRAPQTRDSTVPFKSLAYNLASLLSDGSLRSLSLGIERPFVTDAWDDDAFDDSDDLHLTASEFLSRLLPLIGRNLRSLCIFDYWIQSCWRLSKGLSAISAFCDGLLNLEIRNAWLSVEGLKPMLKLTSLTLEFIRLDDECLDKLNECFPCLRVLKLIGVGGLKEPKIDLPLLKVCYWTASNYPESLSIRAPNLVVLKLKCIDPKTLVLKAPLLSDLTFKIRDPTGLVEFESFSNLRSLALESSDLHSLTQMFKGNRTVTKVVLEAIPSMNSDVWLSTATLRDLVGAFPNMDDLTLGPGAWAALEDYYAHKGTHDAECAPCLKKLMVRLPLLEPDAAFISTLLNICTQLCEVTVLIHANAFEVIRDNIASSCSSNFPNFNWTFGLWRELSDSNMSIYS